MDELFRFIDETPLWLLIVFCTVFAALCVMFAILLVKSLRS